MNDYLSRLAEQAAGPTRPILPLLQPLFSERSMDTPDSETDGHFPVEEFDHEEPSSTMSVKKAWKSNDVVAVPRRRQEVQNHSEQAAPTSAEPEEALGRKSHESLGNSDKPIRLQSSVASTEPRHPEVTVKQFSVNVPQQRRQPYQSAAQASININREQDQSSELSVDDSEVGLGPSKSDKLGLQVNALGIIESVEETPSKPQQIKTIQTKQPKVVSEVHYSVVEIHSEIEQKVTSQSRQVHSRTREIVPLSATAPSVAYLERSQPESSTVVQPAAETIVHVTIGRVEVRATVGQQKPSAGRETSPSQSSHSLEDYLRGNSSGRTS